MGLKGHNGEMLLVLGQELGEFARASGEVQYVSAFSFDASQAGNLEEFCDGLGRIGRPVLVVESGIGESSDCFVAEVEMNGCHDTMMMKVGD